MRLSVAWDACLRCLCSFRGSTPLCFFSLLPLTEFPALHPLPNPHPLPTLPLPNPHPQAFVSGTVRVKLYKGSATVDGRKSDFSLYNQNLSSFEDDGGAYNQKDAEGVLLFFACPVWVVGFGWGAFGGGLWVVCGKWRGDSGLMFSVLDSSPPQASSSCRR